MENNSHNKNFALSLAFIRRFEASIPTYQEKLVQCQRFQMKKGGGGGGRKGVSWAKTDAT